MAFDKIKLQSLTKGGKIFLNWIYLWYTGLKFKTANIFCLLPWHLLLLPTGGQKLEQT